MSVELKLYSTEKSWLLKDIDGKIHFHMEKAIEGHNLKIKPKDYVIKRKLWLKGIMNDHDVEIVDEFLSVPQEHDPGVVDPIEAEILKDVLDEVTEEEVEETEEERIIREKDLRFFRRDGRYRSNVKSMDLAFRLGYTTIAHEISIEIGDRLQCEYEIMVHEQRMQEMEQEQETMSKSKVTEESTNNSTAPQEETKKKFERPVRTFQSIADKGIIGLTQPVSFVGESIAMVGHGIANTAYHAQSKGRRMVGYTKKDDVDLRMEAYERNMKVLKYPGEIGKSLKNAAKRTADKVTAEAVKIKNATLKKEAKAKAEAKTA